MVQTDRVYVVVRFDYQLHPQDEALRFTVVEVLANESAASEEADRLNALNGHLARYSVQSAKWFPLGRSVD